MSPGVKNAELKLGRKTNEPAREQRPPGPVDDRPENLQQLRHAVVALVLVDDAVEEVLRSFADEPALASAFRIVRVL